jgi:hypothetical protein
MPGIELRCSNGAAHPEEEKVMGFNPAPEQ